jgi:hypothetical protein
MKTLALMLCIAFAISLSAQKGLHLGIQSTIGTGFVVNQHNQDIMMNIPDPLISNSDMAYKITPGYDFGAQVLLNLDRHFGVEITPKFFMGGQKYADKYCLDCEIQYSVQKSIEFNQLIVPIRASYIFGDNEKVKFYLKGGPSIGISTSMKKTGDIQVSDKGYVYSYFTLANDELSEVPMFTTLDLGIDLEGGAQIFLIKNVYLSAGLNVYSSLLDINSSAINDLKSKNETSYEGSRFAKAGLSLGLHFVIFNHDKSNNWIKWF